VADDERPAFPLDRGATWLNLLATRGNAFGRQPVERLDSPERLAEWLAVSELRPRRGVLAADLRAALEFRELLRAFAMPVVRGQAPAVAAATGLAGFVREHEEPLTLVTGGRARRPAPGTALAALARVGRQAAEHLTGPERRLLKICSEHDCQGVFADATGRRRWCPAPACASRGRVRALRARRDEAARTR
jgi:predicted RNA-binding Zn ribbon-like protein